jgi:plasmid stabilization system protein ParE
MAYAVSISSRAQRDLIQIYTYIGADDSEAALKWYRGLKKAILDLEALPNRWPVTHENGKLRHILYGGKPHTYRVIYRVLERQKRVEVIHIRHGARQRFKAGDPG